jgi:hypothetical protein
MKHLLFCIVLLISVNCLAASELVIEGLYQGKNLYVQNPYSAGDAEFCTEMVVVNNTVLMTYVKSSAYEIDLSSFKLNEPVTIKITHKEGCSPKVLNPQAIAGAIPFELTAFSVRSGAIEWFTQGESAETLYFVERLMDNSWVAITPPIKATGSVSNAAYMLKINNLQEISKYRIRSVNQQGDVLYSREKEYNPAGDNYTYKPD